MVTCQGRVGSLSNVVEIVTAWYKPQEHLLPVDLHISQTIRDALRHVDLGITPFGKAIGGVVIKVIQFRIL